MTEEEVFAIYPNAIKYDKIKPVCYFVDEEIVAYECEFCNKIILGEPIVNIVHDDFENIEDLPSELNTESIGKLNASMSCKICNTVIFKIEFDPDDEDSESEKWLNLN